MQEKLNKLITTWPKGTIQLASHLQEKGYARHAIVRYVENGWLESIGHGAYKIKNDTVGWQSAVSAVQGQSKSYLHPGGKTALELRGYAHYLNVGESIIFLFGSSKNITPSWMYNQIWSKQVRFVKTKVFNYKVNQVLSEITVNNSTVKASTLELAAMEMLYLVPAEQGFDEAYHIMEGLTSLCPNLVQSLLESCTSVKVKRIFLFMADKAGHEWFRKLNVEKINLGSGKRMIVEGGVFNKTYNITVPKAYEE